MQFVVKVVPISKVIELGNQSEVSGWKATVTRSDGHQCSAQARTKEAARRNALEYALTILAEDMPSMSLRDVFPITMVEL